MGNGKEITEGEKPVNSEFRCGTVALAGRSNVGKSTLLNQLVGAKLAIETSKPQATRSRILGIRTLPAAQILWIDLPGIHRARSTMNVRMVETAKRSIEEADVVLVVIDAKAGFVPEDEAVTALASARDGRWLLAVNKIDLVRRNVLVSLLAALSDRFPDRDVVPMSARTGENLAELERAVATLLPRGPALYAEDEITDQTSRALTQEYIREKIFEVTAEEVPYRTAVVIESFVEKPEKGLNVVHAAILVERDSQKKILVGKGGATIREIGRRSREALEAFFATRFYLELFVKVKHDWTKNPRALDELGI